MANIQPPLPLQLNTHPIKLPRTAKLRARRLLDMMYLSGELAEELGLTDSDVRDCLISAGAPHTIDAEGQIWFHGPTIARWLNQATAPRPSRIYEDEAYCLQCHKVVTMIETYTVQHYAVTLLRGKCPDCRGGVQRGVRQS